MILPRRQFLRHAAAGLALASVSALRGDILGAARRRSGAPPSGGGSFNRFYLPSSGAAAVSPAASGSWTNTSLLARHPLNHIKGSSAMTTVSFTAFNLVNGNKILFRQFVSAPLTAQTISGNIKGQIRALVTGSSDINNRLGVRVVSNDGSTVLATLLDVADVDGYPLGTSLRNATMTSNALSSYACAAGDRLVIEIGMSRDASWGAGTQPVSQSYGEDSGTDLPENNTETAAYNPWVEFSNPISLQ